jgi:type I restriction enzyme S subunit
MSHENNMSSELNGQCPDGWRDKPLSSLAELRVSNVDKKTESGEKPVCLCNYIDVYNNDYITADMQFMRATGTSAEIIRFGVAVVDVIITKDSETPDEIGVPAVVDSTAPDLVCGYHLAVLRPNQGEIDPTFLAKLLAQPRTARYFGQQANGSTRYGLSTASIERTRIWHPDLPVQQAIGRVVRLLDAAIEKTAAVIAKLKHVRAGLLHDLLTRGLDDNGELRDPITHREQFQDTPLGRLPRKWKNSTVGREFPLQRGFDITVENQTHGSVPVVSSSGINSWHDTAMVVGPGVITGRKGKLGDVYYVECDYWPHDTSLWVTRFHGHSPKFAALLLRHLRLERFDAATSVPTLNRNTVHPLYIALPDKDEQDRIVGLTEQFDSLINSELAWLEKLRQLNTGLVSDLLTGRVPVPEGIPMEPPP